MNKQEIMDAIKALSHSQGFYGRLYETLKANTEASVFIDTVKKLHLEEQYMKWLNDHFKDTVPAKSTIEYVITHEWDDFRMHIPYLTLSRFNALMKKLVDSMDDLERVEELKFPMVFSFTNLPLGWARFAKEVYDYALPIKVEVNAEDKAYIITVIKDFREVFEEREGK